MWRAALRSFRLSVHSRTERIADGVNRWGFIQPARASMVTSASRAGAPVIRGVIWDMGEEYSALFLSKLHMTSCLAKSQIQALRASTRHARQQFLRESVQCAWILAIRLNICNIQQYITQMAHSRSLSSTSRRCVGVLVLDPQ